MVVMLLAFLDQTIVLTALSINAGQLEGVSHMQRVTTAQILASTIAMPVCGTLGDLTGRTSLSISSIGIFLAGSPVGDLAIP